ncbi:MAG: response regulator [Bacteroidales bacterium]|jgi:DNA-binding NarL/FixJ family response regulator|nr:response regulator [Bacteroidales bacterium]
MTTVFIIDDDLFICKGFCDVFDPVKDEISIAGYALTVNDAFQELVKGSVDVIILDLYLKFTDPIINFRLLYKRFPLIPIIIFTYETALVWQIKMFQEGAKAFLIKGLDKVGIQQTINQVARGNSVIPAQIKVEVNSGSIHYLPVLKEREREVILKLSSGFSIKEIASMKERTISSIEKSLKKIRSLFKAKNNYELLSILHKQKEL